MPPCRDGCDDVVPVTGCQRSTARSCRGARRRWEQELTKAFAELRIEVLAHERAGIEAVLNPKDRSEEWNQLARFEYELSYEVAFLR